MQKVCFRRNQTGVAKLEELNRTTTVVNLTLSDDIKIYSLVHWICGRALYYTRKSLK